MRLRVCLLNTGLHVLLCVEKIIILCTCVCSMIIVHIC